jgi:hypothetical protein
MSTFCLMVTIRPATNIPVIESAIQECERFHLRKRLRSETSCLQMVFLKPLIIDRKDQEIETNHYQTKQGTMF